MSIWKSITKLARRIVRAELANVHTTLICQIEAYTVATNTATVQPVYKLTRTGGLETVQMPQLEDVPVRQFGSGKLAMTCPPASGSYGYINVSERSIEQWLTNGGITEHGSSRKFDLSDAILEMGLYPLVADGDNGLLAVPVNTDRIELRTRAGTTFIAVVDDGTIDIQAINGTVNMATNGEVTIANGAGSATLTTAGALEVNSSADAAALASKVDLLWTTLYTLLTTWTPVPADGGAAFKTASIAAFPTPPSTVASTKLKVDS